MSNVSFYFFCFWVSHWIVETTKTDPVNKKSKVSKSIFNKRSSPKVKVTVEGIFFLYFRNILPEEVTMIFQKNPSRRSHFDISGKSFGMKSLWYFRNIFPEEVTLIFQENSSERSHFDISRKSFRKNSLWYFRNILPEEVTLIFQKNPSGRSHFDISGKSFRKKSLWYFRKILPE